MPTSTLSRSRLLARLGPEVPFPRIEEALFASKAELGGPVEGDALEVSVTPDRLDLLSEGGLALHLAGALGLASGGVRRSRRRSAAVPLRFAVDASVAPLRPGLAGALVQAPLDHPLDDGLLAEAVRVQELVHATVGRDRRAASLGIYPARRLRSPVRYALEPLSGVRFVPLGGEEPVDGPTFFAEHPLAARYGALGRDGDRCLTLRDAAGEILSLPPILNGRLRGEARAGDRRLLLESTGTRERSVREALGLLLGVFATAGWAVRPVPMDGPGPGHSDGEAVVADRPVILPAELLRASTGTTLRAPEVADRLARARLAARRVRGGWRVSVPPWRPDLIAPIDLVEEVVIAGGLRPEDGVVPPSPVRGARRAETRFQRGVAEILLGLGFAEPLTTVLVSDVARDRLGATEALLVRNPVSREYSVVRDRLLLSHLDLLARTTRRGYPQRFAEVGPVVVRRTGAEPRAESRIHAGLVLAAERAGFADAAAVIEEILRALDVGSVREPAELPGLISGRAARVRVAGEPIAELGEVHPRILRELGVPVAVAWAELDLSALAPLAVGSTK